MPIDIQCPDCEHVFAVPTALAGKRTLCRSCNAALLVPEATAESGPIPRERRSQTPAKPKDDAPPNWDTPLPFHSPLPIIGALGIAFIVSLIVLIAYSFLHGSRSVATRPTLYSPPVISAPPPTRPDTKTNEPSAITGYEREIILPDCEVVLPKSSQGHTMDTATELPSPFVLTQISGTAGRGFLYDGERGQWIGSIPSTGFRGVQKTAVAHSGKWIACREGARLQVFAAGDSDSPILTWSPYGEAADSSLNHWAFVGDDRLLTVSADRRFDLWALPSGDYLRRVTFTLDSLAVAVDSESKQLAVRGNSRLEVFSLDDDEFGSATRISVDTAKRVQLRWSPDGKRIVSVHDGRGIEVFDIAKKQRIANWTLPNLDADSRNWRWSVSFDGILSINASGRMQENQLSDGKLRAMIELGSDAENAVLDGPNSRLVVRTGPPYPSHLVGFRVPTRTPANLQKNPVWEYKAGVLELRKPTQ